MVDDPEGIMVELFPNIDRMPLPGKAHCPPEHIDAALGQIRATFGQLTENLELEDGFRLLLFEMQQQQQ